MIELANKPEPTVRLTLTREVPLNSFRDEAIIEYLLGRGYGVDGERKPVKIVQTFRTVEPENCDVVIEGEVLETVTRLILAGQRAEAIEEIRQRVNKQLPLGVRL